MFRVLSLKDSSPTLDHRDWSQERREIEEYLKEHTFDNLEDAFAFLSSGKRAAHVKAEAAEDEALSQQSSPDRYEDCPVPALEQHQSLAAEGQYSKVSKKEIAQNGKKWMTEEMKVAFEKYMKEKIILRIISMSLMSFSTSVLVWKTTTRSSTTLTSP
ncbi:hypothetical protein PVAP13_9NG388546 [Panicum virgatum]|nr:hypothetical protein PVAP13_9NG388546 [Panicum virgatum]KAG2538076.1 hypothetical protein PVAP13_9NG388546 [Panicum virgatum]KAG2538077.1 hypothetical protein PVAP13_9NG388546 [Panicum virgatum]KAG2538078.1 hypothetical protein PVAP13_9NG388546 [Panicum virgatum]